MTMPSGMESQLLELETLLRDELTVCGHMVNRLPFKLALIKKNRTAQLERLIVQEAEDMAAMGELEARRVAICEAIAREHPLAEPTLKAQLSALPRAWQERLEPLGAELRTKVEELQAGNRTCRELLNLSIAYAAYTLELIAQAATPDGMGYGDHGATAPSLLLDRRA